MYKNSQNLVMKLMYIVCGKGLSERFQFVVSFFLLVDLSKHHKYLSKTITPFSDLKNEYAKHCLIGYPFQIRWTIFRVQEWKLKGSDLEMSFMLCKNRPVRSSNFRDHWTSTAVVTSAWPAPCNMAGIEARVSIDDFKRRKVPQLKKLWRDRRIPVT